jgi:hypothetical protein
MIHASNDPASMASIRPPWIRNSVLPYGVLRMRTSYLMNGHGQEDCAGLYLCLTTSPLSASASYFLLNNYRLILE